MPDWFPSASYHVPRPTLYTSSPQASDPHHHALPHGQPRSLSPLPLFPLDVIMTYDLEQDPDPILSMTSSLHHPFMIRPVPLTLTIRTAIHYWLSLTA